MIEFVNLMSNRTVLMSNASNIDQYWYGDWILEPMHFGIRVQCLIDDKDVIHFHGKKKSYREMGLIKYLDKLFEEVASYKLPKESLFDCYITFNNDSNLAYKFIRNKKFDRCLNDFNFYFCDVIFIQGEKIFEKDTLQRKKILSYYIYDKEYVKLQTWYLGNKKKVYENQKNEFDTFCFKKIDSPYYFHRSVSFRILRIPESAFLIIMGFVTCSIDEKRKFKVFEIESGVMCDGKVNKLMNIKVLGEDAQSNLYNIREKMLGKVFEILYYGYTITNKYSEVEFFRFRDDIEPKECVFKGRKNEFS